MTLGERIKKVRRTLDLTQREFGERISIKQNSVAQIEMGRNTSDQTIVSICREFNINETWLRTGEGDPFVQRSKEDELAQVFSAISASDDELIKRIIRAYWKLDSKEKAAVKKLIDGFSSDGSSASPAAPAFAPAPARTIEEEARAEAKEYYYQLLAEKERAARSPASPDDTGGSAPKMA